MAWFPVRLFQHATPHRQALRRHAQRRHAHFYQLRSDWTVFRSWPFADLDWRRNPWVIAAATTLVGLLGMAVLPSFASIFRGDASGDAPAVILALPEQPIATFVPGEGDERIALIDGVYAPLSEASQWTSVTIERGQTLGEIFANFGISSRQLARLVLAAPSADSFTRLRPGDRIGIRRDAAGTLTALQLNVDSDTRRVVEISGEALT